MIRIFSKQLLFPTIFTLFAVLVFSSLGIWQTKRLIWKQELINGIKVADELPILEYSGDKELSEYLYHRIKVRGEFLYDKEILLGPTYLPNSKEIGFFSVIPFRTDYGNYVLVNRGMIANKYKEQDKRKETLPNDKITIEGRILPTPVKKFIAPKNYPEKNIWTWLDVKLFASFTNLDIKNYYILASNSGLEELYDKDKLKNIDGLPIIINKLNIRNDHLEYLLTWFSLAIVAIVIYSVYVKRIIKKN